MSKISLGSISITPQVLEAWKQVASLTVQAVRDLGVDVSDIGEEEVFIQDDGKTLLIVCGIGPLEAKMVVPAGQWCWAN